MATLCGRACSFTVDGESYDSHIATLNLSGVETDVTKFGSGEYGDYVVCSINGTINASFYGDILSALAVGDVVKLIFTLGYTEDVTLTFNDAVVQSINSAIDSKGIAMFDAVFRLTGYMVIGSTTDSSESSESS